MLMHGAEQVCAVIAAGVFVFLGLLVSIKLVIQICPGCHNKLENFLDKIIATVFAVFALDIAAIFTVFVWRFLK